MAEPISRDQNLRRVRGQGNIHFPCSADHEQDWQPYLVDPNSGICDNDTYIHTVFKIITNSKKGTAAHRDTCDTLWASGDARTHTLVHAELPHCNIAAR